jgi:hypothetical protein
MVNNVSKPIENEDERIRQALLTKFVGEKNQGAKYTIHGCSLDSIITYLEKQKEESHDGKKWIYEDDYHKDMERCFNDGKDEVLENPKKYGLQKEQKPVISDEAIRDGVVHFGITQYQIDNWLKKHINIVEQKPAEWNSEDEQNLNVCLSYIKDEPLRSWLKDAIHVRYDKPAEWSEEDGRMIEDLIRACHGWAMGTVELLPSTAFEYEKRLKSLRPQPKQEWSEEDEVMLGKCIDAASGYYSPDDKSAMKAWLESLHEKFNLRPK